MPPNSGVAPMSVHCSVQREAVHGRKFGCHILIEDTGVTLEWLIVQVGIEALLAFPKLIFTNSFT